MRAFASALAISLALAPVAAGAAPERVASLNLCTDELLLSLARPEQVASVTHLAHKEAETPLWRQASAYPSNDGSLLSIVGSKPDLVVTMGGGARDRVRIAGRLGLRVLDLPYPMTLRDMERNIALTAVALGRREAGKRLLVSIGRLKRSAPRQSLDTIWLGGGGRTVDPAGLTAEWMRLAGLGQRALPGDQVSLEQLIASPPAILLRSDYRSDQYSGEQRWLGHSLARAAGKARTIRTDGRRWTCMGPPLISEVQRLRRALGS